MFTLKKAFDPAALLISLRGDADGFEVRIVTNTKERQVLVSGVRVADEGFTTELVRVLRAAGIEFDGPEITSREALEDLVSRLERQAVFGDDSDASAEGGIVPPEEVENFPRMKLVREVILATGGRATRAKMGEAAAIIGAFVQFELEQALKAIDDEAGAPSTLPPAGPGDGAEHVELQSYTLKPGEERAFEFVAATVLRGARIEVEPREAVSIVEIRVGDDVVPPDVLLAGLESVLRLASGERMTVKVKSESGVDVELVVRLRGIVTTAQTDPSVPPLDPAFGLRERTTGR